MRGVAELYLKGFGADKDLSRAFDWYSAAAVRGHAGAQNMLGVLYLTGKGVPADRAKAEIWWRLAAEQGHAAAQRNLARL